MSGLHQVDGKNGNDNETSVKGPVFTKGRPSTVQCSLRNGGVTVFVDGKNIIRWSGDFRRLASNPGFKVPHPRALSLGVWASKYAIRKMTLIPVTGRGAGLR